MIPKKAEENILDPTKWSVEVTLDDLIQTVISSIAVEGIHLKKENLLDN